MYGWSTNNLTLTEGFSMENFVELNLIKGSIDSFSADISLRLEHELIQQQPNGKTSNFKLYSREHKHLLRNYHDIVCILKYVRSMDILIESTCSQHSRTPAEN